MEIKYSKHAIKAIQSLPKNIKQNFKTRIEGLTKDPPEGDIKPMKGYSPEQYRLRIGKYRVIFQYRTINDTVILYIIDIGSRGDIYK